MRRAVYIFVLPSIVVLFAACNPYHISRQFGYKRVITGGDSALNVTDIDFHETEFQLRFRWSKNVLDTNASLAIFSLNKDKHWYLQFYNYDKNQLGMFKLKQSFTIELDSSWNDKWRYILRNGLLNIKSQREVIKSWRAGNPGEGLGITDGDIYSFEVLTKKKKRKFVYSNPQAYLNFYTEKHEGLEEVINLIGICKSEIQRATTVIGREANPYPTLLREAFTFIILFHYRMSESLVSGEKLLHNRNYHCFRTTE